MKEDIVRIFFVRSDQSCSTISSLLTQTPITSPPQPLSRASAFVAVIIVAVVVVAFPWLIVI